MNLPHAFHGHPAFAGRETQSETSAKHADTDDPKYKGRRLSLGEPTEFDELKHPHFVDSPDSGAHAFGLRR